MPRYLVVSIENDEPYDHWDFVEAKDEEAASRIVATARKSHFGSVTSVFTAAQLFELLNTLLTDKDIAKTANQLRKQIGE